MLTTLVDCEELEANLDDKRWIVVDTRSKVNPKFHGETAYRTEHVAGAVYANLDRDLAAPHEPGKTGRHPLPPVDEFEAFVGSLGIDSTRQVVVYDDMGGGYAARLWWMLRWLGHPAVAVLDGGWQKWSAEGRPTRSGIETNDSAVFTAKPRETMRIEADELARFCEDSSCFVGDSRIAERFRGENETLDPVAGHIPGAVSLPYGGNIRPDWTLLPMPELRTRFGPLSGYEEGKVAFYCGSGVTAALNVLAAVHAGLPEPRLYVGSWSEWITDPTRGVTR